MRTLVLTAAFGLLLTALQLPAPARADEPPLPGALPLSEIIAKLERQGNVAYIERVDLDDGFYDIVFRTTDGRDIEITVDPRTGDPR